jgi:hypothetical protein
MKHIALKRKSKSETKNCRQCKKDFIFTLYPSQVKSGHKGNYCSRDCFVAFSKSNSFNFPCLICGIAVFVQPAQLKYRARTTKVGYKKMREMYEKK